MSTPPLSRREREILDILYGAEGLTAAEVRERLADPPSNSAVRALLRILEEKGHVRHEERGPRFVFSPVVSRVKASRSALTSMLDTFFGGSTEDAVAALLDVSRDRLDAAELERIAGLIEQARKEGR
jgi:predicted transcriptional regulator